MNGSHQNTLSKTKSHNSTMFCDEKQRRASRILKNIYISFVFNKWQFLKIKNGVLLLYRRVLKKVDASPSFFMQFEYMSLLLLEWFLFGATFQFITVLWQDDHILFLLCKIYFAFHYKILFHFFNCHISIFKHYFRYFICITVVEGPTCSYF